ncbi:MAG: MFS transporter [Peptococcaceae bacterium BICA1-7]|nr:MAG: MFS transporter [Peptococcaceae bacterium BICA1-7]HBV98154.1 MFS transporter [Desulfotomaculum sp.]
MGEVYWGLLRTGTGALAALRHRNFRLFWTGQCISLVGGWMQYMAQAWLVLELTDSSFLLGVIWACQFGPTLLLSLVAGVVADRFPKRRIILFTQSANMLLALLLGILVLTGAVQYWHVAVLAFLLGISNTLDVPARQSFVVEMVGKEDLMNAIALNSSVFNGARIIGPALAGLIIAQTGTAACFLINSASFLPVLAGLLLMRLKDPPGGRKARDFAGEMKSGMTYIFNTPDVFYPLLLTGILSAFAMNFHVLVPVYATEVLGREAQGFGFMMTAVGIGAFVGAGLLAFLSRYGPRQVTIYISAAGLCVFQLALSGISAYGPSLVFLTLLGWSMATFTASVNSFIQFRSPHEIRGRVMSVFILLFSGMMPVGSIFSGLTTKYLGVQAGFLISGIIGAMAIVIVLWRAGIKRGGHPGNSVRSC